MEEKNEIGSEKGSSDKGVLEKEEKSETSIQGTEKGTPAEKASQIGGQAEKVWKGFLFSEKMITIGALVGIVSFFLPWISFEAIEIINISGMRIARGYDNLMLEGFSWLYLYPILMLLSLGIIYFTQGASKIGKTLMARWQILIGSVFAFIGVIGVVNASIMFRAIGGFGVDISIGIGWWFLTLGFIAILVGAFKLQKDLLK